MAFFIYQFFFSLFIIIYAPLHCLKLIFSSKNRKNSLPILGFQKIHCFNDEDEVFWIHSISVGETQVAQQFIKLLKKQYPQVKIVISTITSTGQKIARSIPECDFSFYYPLDFYPLINSIFKRINPKKIFIVENDFWLTCLHIAKKRRIPIYLINGKMSEKSFNLYKKFPLFSPYFNSFKKILVQSDEYAHRFSSLIKNKKIIKILGNIKLDKTIPLSSTEEKNALIKSLKIPPSKPIVVFASTHQGEELLALKVIKNFIKQEKDYYFILAPRHPERFKSVEKLLEKNFIHYSLSQGEKKNNSRVTILNELGKLMKVFEISDLAIICGSFNKNVGGHNIFEPIFVNTPFLYGPFMYKQKDFVKLSKKYNLGKQVLSDELAQAIDDSIKNSIKKQEDFHTQCKKFILETKGVTQKTLNEVIE